MRLTPTFGLDDDAVLAADLPGPRPGIPLLRAGVKITPTIRERLVAEGISQVWIEDPLTDDVMPIDAVSAETRAKASQAVLDAFANARSAALSEQAIPREAIEQLTSVAELIVKDVASIGGAAAALTDLATADAYTHTHSVNVCAIGLLIADAHFQRHGWTDWQGTTRWDSRAQRLRVLGLGLLLHDIGKAAIPLDILNKPGKLDPAEWALMKTHPTIGAGLLPQNDVPMQVFSVIRDHHERHDGSGYPRGKTGEELHIFAAIAAVADTYDAIVSERLYQAARPTHIACRIIESGAGSAFNADVVDAFTRVVAPYPLGAEIELPDGRTAVVVDVDMDDRWRPTVRTYDHAGLPEQFTFESADDPSLAQAA